MSVSSKNTKIFKRLFLSYVKPSEIYYNKKISGEILLGFTLENHRWDEEALKNDPGKISSHKQRRENNSDQLTNGSPERKVPTCPSGLL